MNIDHNNISISMTRSNLDNIPQYELPSSYKIIWWQKGYEIFWLNIHKEADLYNSVSLDLFNHEFGDNFDLLRDRQCYLIDPNGIAIGTATAWFNNNYNGQIYGRIHWIAIVPKMQGRGLANPLMTIICNRLRELKYTKAYLITSIARIPAINLYLKFGFVPKVKNNSDALAWNKVSRQLKYYNYKL